MRIWRSKWNEKSLQQNDNWIEEIFYNSVVIFWYRGDLLENMGTIHCNTGCDKGDEGIQPPETPGKNYWVTFL